MNKKLAKIFVFSFGKLFSFANFLHKSVLPIMALFGIKM